ncbi:DUF5926 family protein [Lapillicoccus sp.]|uniref:DUF5926 family protein n=1 Tax=Lapillicoccus sp. TaxID=1909287 RepID=UPI003982D9AF
MGKASRRRSTRSTEDSPRVVPAPFVARPFEGLPSETEWVALREILPAATASVSFAAGRAPEGATVTATIATVLPMAWPALHRNGGEVFVATQSGATSGDPSRDLAAALLLASSAAEGTPVTSVPTPTADTPRLQDLLDVGQPFEVVLHDGFDFWVGDADLDAEGRDSLDRANESVIATERVPGATSVYWCAINGRSYVRWVLPHDEDRATDALARLHAAGQTRLSEDARLLGAFRAGGLLVPVWEVPTEKVAADFADVVVAMAPRIDAAAASSDPLTADERRARAGLLNRQVTLR